MAHVARINELGETLITGITGRNRDDPEFKQTLNETTKGLRNSSYARTNQFEVRSKLDGLVEKFAVLNRDDLAEELQTRVDELPTKSKWLPEILSLLLLLSDRPAEKTGLEDLEALIKPPENQHTLTWKEIFAHEPLDDSGIWDDVERGYHSSGDEATAHEEDETTSTKATSVGDEDLVALARLHVVHPDENALDEIKNAHARLVEEQSKHVSISELTIVRESLSMLQGLPTSTYDVQSWTGKVSASQKFALDTATRQVLNDMIARCADLGSSINTLRAWLRKDVQVLHLQSCQASIQGLLMDFASQLAAIEKKFASPQTQPIVSIMDVRKEVESLANPLLHLSRLVQKSEEESKTSPFALLDLLHYEACIAQMSGDPQLTMTLAHVLCAGLRTYLKPVSIWVRNGFLADYDQTFFVIEANKDCELGKIWHERFTMRTLADGRLSVPEFLLNLARRIFALGKSRAFLAALNGGSVETDDTVKHPFPDVISLAERLNSFSLMPFSEVLSDALESWIADIGKDCTPLLCTTLLQERGLLNTLNGLAESFCSQNGRLFQAFADTLFWRMDTGKSWRDRFLLTELAQSTLGSAANVVAETLTVAVDGEQGSLPNSSITQLGTLKLEMLFSWPVQNVTRSQSPASYSKTFTFLLQVYRSKYLLRRQIIELRSLDSQTKRLPRSVSIALSLRQALIAIVDTLYNHITSTAWILSVRLRKDVQAADGIDTMADIWAQHEKQVEASLLLTPNLKPLRDAVVGVLKLYEQFCDAWRSLMTKAKSGESHASNAGDEQGGTGSDSTAEARNLTALQSDLEKSLSFITAGLRATSRAGGNTALEALADRLDWRVMK